MIIKLKYYNTTMKKTKMAYVAPRVHQVEFKIEKGFAGSQILAPFEAHTETSTWINDETFNNADRGTYFQR